MDGFKTARFRDGSVSTYTICGEAAEDVGAEDVGSELCIYVNIIPKSCPRFQSKAIGIFETQLHLYHV